MSHSPPNHTNAEYLSMSDTDGLLVVRPPAVLVCHNISVKFVQSLAELVLRTVLYQPCTVEELRVKESFRIHSSQTDKRSYQQQKMS